MWCNKVSVFGLRKLVCSGRWNEVEKTVMLAKFWWACIIDLGRRCIKYL